MDYLPLFVDLRHQHCLVVGGGPVAARKTRRLLSAGAKVHLCARVCDGELMPMIDAGHVRWLATAFSADLLEGMRLAIAATDDSATNRAVFEAGEARGVLVNSVDDPAASRFITPSLVDRSPVTVAISTGGHAPVLARRLRERIEAILASRTGVLARLAGRLRRRAARSIPDARARRQFWEWLVDGPVASLVYAGRIRAAYRTASQALTPAAKPSTPSGLVSLVGAGPGDPGLLTLNALQRLQRADVIVHDRLVPEAVLDMARRDAERIDVGKRPGAPAGRQTRIHTLVSEHAERGRHVVRLKGGDPAIFGRAGEELAHLRERGIEVEIVPGITAASAGAAAASLSLTHRHGAHSLHLVTGHDPSPEAAAGWSDALRQGATLAVYMGRRRAAAISSALAQCGVGGDMPVAVVENASQPRQRVQRGRLAELAELTARGDARAPCVLLIGEALRAQSEPLDDSAAPQSMPLASAGVAV